MKTKLFILLAALSFSAVSLIAQEAKTMYVMKDGAVIFQSAVLGVDSIIFYEPIREDGVLINGVVWAKYNVDAPGTFAAKPEDAGMFYQWNRNIGWSAIDPMINSNSGTTWDDSTPTGDTWEKANDPSPAGWRVPTTEEQQTLLDTDKVTCTWVNSNGVYGRLFTDNTTGVSIFLSAAGCRDYVGGTLNNVGSYGAYWSSAQPGGDYAYNMYFNSIGAYWYDGNRSFGFFVRCVADK